jgi:hypothetical protein
MNKICFEIVFKLRQNFFFSSAYKYIRYCVSYILKFLRSPEKVFGIFILGYVSLAWTVDIIIVAMMLPVRLDTHFLPLLVDIVTHSVIYTR